jgi:hypothetical protein
VPAGKHGVIARAAVRRKKIIERKEDIEASSLRRKIFFDPLLIPAARFNRKTINWQYNRNRYSAIVLLT